MNSSWKIGQERKKEGGGRVEVRPINKQRIDFLPLSVVPGEPPPRLHHPVTLISTYVKDTPHWGKPPPTHTHLPLPPPAWLIACLGHLPGTVHLR